MVDAGAGPAEGLEDRPGRRRKKRRLTAVSEAARTIPINVAIVGVQKAATSTLYTMLTAHPEVARGPQKEMRIFLRDGRDWENPRFPKYVRAATDDRQHLACDATPAYLIHPHALARMHAYNPDMRLIATFRDPIERAVSQWSMQRERDADFPELPDTVARWAHAAVPDAVPEGLSLAEFGRQTLYTRGLYGQQLRRGMALFPADQWLCLDFRGVVADHEATLERVTDFLGIARFDRVPPLPHRNSTSRGLAERPLSVADVRRLVDLYAPDLAEFTALSGVDIGRWPTARVAAGELPVEEFAATLAAKVTRPA